MFLRKRSHSRTRISKNDFLMATTPSRTHCWNLIFSFNFRLSFIYFLMDEFSVLIWGKVSFYNVLFFANLHETFPVLFGAGQSYMVFLFCVRHPFQFSVLSLMRHLRPSKVRISSTNFPSKFLGWQQKNENLKKIIGNPSSLNYS